LVLLILVLLVQALAALKGWNSQRRKRGEEPSSPEDAAIFELVRKHIGEPVVGIRYDSASGDALGERLAAEGQRAEVMTGYVYGPGAGRGHKLTVERTPGGWEILETTAWIA
jgi:hypothetical protein